MSAALNTDEQPLANDGLAGEDEALAHGYEYRELSGMAFISVAVGAVALAMCVFYALFHPFVFALLPLLGAVIGLRAWRQIAQSEGELEGLGIAYGGIGLSVGALLLGWGTMAYVYATEVPEGFTRIQYADLKLAETGEVPKEAVALDGQKVFIKGYIYPDTETVGIKKFILCRDNGDCCFGGKPPLSDMIEVALKPGQSLAFAQRQFKVYGTFRFEPAKSIQQEAVGAVLYHIDDARYVE